MTHWLDGNIICEESKRYVSNFISIYRLRPGEDEEDGMANSDDLVEDEEVFVTRDMLEDVLNTRIGGKTCRGDTEDVLGDGHHMNSSEAIELGRNVWQIEESFPESVKQSKIIFVAAYPGLAMQKHVCLPAFGLQNKPKINLKYT